MVLGQGGRSGQHGVGQIVRPVAAVAAVRAELLEAALVPQEASKARSGRHVGVHVLFLRLAAASDDGSRSQRHREREGGGNNALLHPVPLDLLDGHAGLLVIGLFRQRAVGVLHREVDERLLREERGEHHAGGRFGAPGRGTTLMSNWPKRDLTRTMSAVQHAELLAVLGAHVEQRLGQRAVELGTRRVQGCRCASAPEGAR